MMQHVPKEFQAITTKDKTLLYKLSEFYGRYNNINKVSEILCGNSKISLRFLEWFITKYAKQNDIMYSPSYKNSGMQSHAKCINIYGSYKKTLYSNSRQYFSIFNKDNSVKLKINNKINTTISQLNFFKWILENKILDYITDNYTELRNIMRDKSRCVGMKKNKNSAKLGIKIKKNSDSEITIKFI